MKDQVKEDLERRVDFVDDIDEELALHTIIEHARARLEGAEETDGAFRSIATIAAKQWDLGR